MLSWILFQSLEQGSFPYAYHCCPFLNLLEMPQSLLIISEMSSREFSGMWFGMILSIFRAEAYSR